jgi:hypothetical protein
MPPAALRWVSCAIDHVTASASAPVRCEDDSLLLAARTDETRPRLATPVWFAQLCGMSDNLYNLA